MLRFFYIWQIPISGLEMYSWLAYENAAVNIIAKSLELFYYLIPNARISDWLILNKYSHSKVNI
jgi:hypothetical protein